MGGADIAFTGEEEKTCSCGSKEFIVSKETDYIYKINCKLCGK